MEKKLGEETLAWIRNNLDLFNFTPKVTISALLVHIETQDIETKQYRAEIERLRQLVDEKAKDERRMFKEAERLQDDVVKLLRELKEARDAKKVALPMEVAEAVKEIRYSQDGLTDYAILRIILESKLYKSAREALNDRYPEDSCTRIMEALVNGYKVEPEQTPKQKAIQHCIKHGLVARGHSEHDVVSAIMSILGTEQSG